MIQRIQSLYLVLAFLASGALPFLLPLWFLQDNKAFFFMQNQVTTILFGLSTALSVFSLISFQKRQRQFVTNRLNLLLNLILIGYLISLAWQTPTITSKGLALGIPFLVMVLLFLANKAIKKDEDLIKSIDRLR